MRDSVETAPARRPWEPMKLQAMGRVADLVQQGGGKLSQPTGDGGEPFRKPPGHA